MSSTFTLGTVAGIRVGAHWSVLGILVILVVALGFRSWPVIVPGYAAVAYVAAAVVAALLFLVSLLAHELAHAVVARRQGVEVNDITLWLLGGLASLRSEAKTPGADLRIAAAGPLASVVAAAVFGALAWLLVVVDAPTLVVLVAAYLAVLNVVLAAFNLVPAAPLDGGRILRAALWAWRGDRDRAAWWSARAGRGFGIALILLGAWQLLFVGTGNGLWWVLIGLFVVTVAGAEEQQARLGSTLADVRVSEVMSADPDTTEGARSVHDFLHGVLLQRRHSAFPVVDEQGRVEGLVTLNRLRSVPLAQRATTTVREIAALLADVPVTEPDARLTDLLPALRDAADGRALVFDGDRLTGIVTPTDVSRAVAVRGLVAGSGSGGSGG
ncbi:CBS domain-containing protein [Saccharomonospora piscinae]|uniref:site-2 protease family protein n=1 Tax=Saccharomonospora piscinae TaxID=687388 RepID=UPI0011068C19|nr:site-2 protease family protein [Saccharomonospora piscinae]TLW91101.1 CBS domain-containing protein [Saccharomonospora piscinae]